LIQNARLFALVETPLHPEYPCAHCITSAAARAVLEAEFGTAPHALSMTSPTAPGVERKWTSIKRIRGRSFSCEDLWRNPLQKLDRSAQGRQLDPEMGILVLDRERNGDVSPTAKTKFSGILPYCIA
jgi:hypothetical protein